MGDHVFWFMGGAAIFALVCLIYAAVDSIKESLNEDDEDEDDYE